MMPFEAGNFVAVGENNRIGIVRANYRETLVVSNNKRVNRIEIEVWFGNVGDNGLPVTCFVPANQCVNIADARTMIPFFTMKENNGEI